MHNLTIGDVFCLSAKTPFSIEAERQGVSIRKQVEGETIFDLFVSENEKKEKRLALHFEGDDTYITMTMDDFLPLSNIVDVVGSTPSQVVLTNEYEAKSISIQGDVSTHSIWEGEITVYDIIPSEHASISEEDSTITLGTFDDSKETLISVLDDEGEEKSFLITIDHYEDECVSYVEKLDEDRMDYYLEKDKQELLCTNGTFALVDGLSYGLSLVFDEHKKLQFLHICSEGRDQILTGDEIKEEELAAYNVKGLGLA